MKIQLLSAPQGISNWRKYFPKNLSKSKCSVSNNSFVPPVQNVTNWKPHATYTEPNHRHFLFEMTLCGVGSRLGNFMDLWKVNATQ